MRWRGDVYCSSSAIRRRCCAGWRAHLRPGGIVAFQEPGNATLRPDALPPSPLLEQTWEWIMETYRRAGMDLKMGLRLFHCFQRQACPRHRCAWTRR
jgi:hypothetical protein